ncbi:MAG: ABC transporter ATP-binding protein [Fusobacterium sp.]|uniref:ABC transporter ATP-binding protein n=1 Tax=Fusobacterium sp. TaxID=68766 RepID=UPI0025F188D0|nr:ABC transporter ATP-binding protein [uncultured Fusobacterium sp.]
MKKVLSCEDIEFKYQINSKKNIIDGFSYDFLEGKVYLISGFSGCGKSTLAYILSGLYPEHKGIMSKGKVLLLNREISEYSPNERVKDIMMMFQNSDAQFCMEKVKDEIIFCLENIEYPVEKMDELVDRVLSEMDILYLKDRDLSSLSGGEKQKVALAIILAISPKIIILDEPFANVDYESSQEIIQKLKRLNEENKTTIIAIDHRISLWKDIEYEFLYLGKGCKILDDTSYFELEDSEEIKENRENLKEKEVVLELENISIGYGEKKLLENCSLIAREGEIVSLVGKSGAGKSSLLLNITGLTKIKNGTIKFLGKDIKRWKRKEILKNIGIVFQNPQNQFITYKVIDELIFSMKQNEKDEKKLLERAENLLKQFNLYEYRNYSPFALSQGQQRKVAVLSMLSGDQKILLCDEPTYGQDNRTSKEIMEFLKKRANEGLTIIIVSHDRNLVYEYSDSIYEVTEEKELRRVR